MNVGVIFVVSNNTFDWYARSFDSHQLINKKNVMRQDSERCCLRVCEFKRGRSRQEREFFCCRTLGQSEPSQPPRARRLPPTRHLSLTGPA